MVVLLAHPSRQCRTDDIRAIPSPCPAFPAQWTGTARTGPGATVRMSVCRPRIGRPMVDGTDALGENVQFGAGAHCHMLTEIREDRRISAGRPVRSVPDL